MDDRELRSGKYLVSLEITDFTDSIAVKIFLGDEMPRRNLLQR